MSLADGYRRKQFKAPLEGGSFAVTGYCGKVKADRQPHDVWANAGPYNGETLLFERKGKRPPDNRELCSRLNKVH